MIELQSMTVFYKPINNQNRQLADAKPIFRQHILDTNVYKFHYTIQCNKLVCAHNNNIHTWLDGSN